MAKNIERRVAELEQRNGAGARVTTIAYEYGKPEDHNAALDAARAQYEAEHGSIGPDTQVVYMAFGPAGRRVETPVGSRWQYPDGSLTDDPTGTRHSCAAEDCGKA